MRTLSIGVHVVSEEYGGAPGFDVGSEITGRMSWG